ncbi:MAG: hypothetical protein KBF45_06390 [Cyclobacteriaceae bacterium]|jgi:hypothetical protein|nr:hypothetical protein [Cyclobacteriaceae bacterium]
MKASFTFVFVLIAGFSAYSQTLGEFKLPKTWEKDFTVSLANHGSMSAGATDLRFTYDSCIYTVSSKNKAKRKVYLLKELDRVSILRKLQELKVDEIRPKSTYATVNDGWSESLCFSINCIEGGTSVELTDSDRISFSGAYRFLEEFAIKKTR